MIKQWLALVALGMGFVGAMSCAHSDAPTTSSGLGGSGGGGNVGGAGGSGVCTKAGDCPAPKSGCVVATCDGGQCATKNAEVGTSCDEGGGRVCDGKGACVPCVGDVDCPAPDDECVVATCQSNTCKTTSKEDGAATKTGQVDGDCKQRVCDGRGATRQADDDHDAPDDQDACTVDACAAGVPTHDAAAPHTACTTPDGGRFCGSGTKAGTCVECITTADCTGTEVCDTAADHFLCVAASCTDTIKDGTETGVDCGGDCSGCANGIACGDGDDCASGYCSASVCAACTADTNCDAGDYCDVGTGVCRTDKSNGQACTGGAMCTSGHCIDGVCCDTTCTGTCNACSAAKKGQGADGTCGPIHVGDDPDHECTAVAGQPCGKVGMCDGANACKLAPSGTICNPASCNASILDKADTCNGAGQCVDNGTQACSPYLCSSGACPNSCTGDAACVPGDFCQSGACVPKRVLGASCGTGGQCASGFCADGVCCNSACNGTCQSCTLTVPGTCDVVPPGSTDADTCTGLSVCVAGGGCLHHNGVACSVGSECASNFCVDGFCCGSACGGACMACSAAKTSGTNGVCQPIVANTDPDAECAGAYVCAAGGVCQGCSDGAKDGAETDTDCGGGCTGCALGLHCSINGDCQSNRCTGGFCVVAQICGNGTIETGETCDDGNVTASDGCSATCQCEASRIKTMSGLALAVTDDGYTGTLASMSCVNVVMPAVTGCPANVTAVRVGLGMDHSWVGDLTVKVVSPAGTVVTLMSRPGVVEAADNGSDEIGNSSNLSKSSLITFQQGAATSAENLGSTTSTFTSCQDDGICSFAPARGSATGGDLTTLNGQAIAGTWRVCVGDGSPADVGTIDTVRLTISN